MNNYCIVQEASTDHQHILGLLLSIELYDKNSTCIICCNEQTEKYIKAFPKAIELNLDFILIDTQFTCLNYVKNIFNSLKYSINKYQDCILLSKDLIMTNPIHISAEIKTQKIGYIKKTINVANEFQRYSINILYLNDINYVDLFIKYYETEMKIADADADADADAEDLCIKIFAHLPLHFVLQYELIFFLYNYTYVGSEDFFAYENSINMRDITKNLTIYGNPISFCNIDKHIQQLNNNFSNILINKHIVYMSLLNIKMSNKKLQLVVPKRKGVGIWNRTNDVGGLYELVDYFVEHNKKYLSQVEGDIDYFSFGNFLLTDKPSHIWLNNTIKKYTKIFICNYDQSLIETLSTMGKATPSSFLFYYSYHPKLLEEFLNEHEINIERTIDSVNVAAVEQPSASTLLFRLAADNNEETVDFNQLMTKLCNVKYGVMEKMDINLVATYLALGVVPVIKNSDANTIYELVENVHYIRSMDVLRTDYEELQKNGLLYYQENIKPAAALNKLFNHVFIRQIE